VINVDVYGPHGLNSVGRDIAYYMQGMGLEPQTPHFSTFKMCELQPKGKKANGMLMFTEYGSKGVISIKGDVYSYGIMLMEIFTGKKPTNEMFVQELTLKTWISESMPNSVMEVVDYNLVSQHGNETHEIVSHVSSILDLALRCCADSPEARISMTDVTASLIKIKILFI